MVHALVWGCLAAASFAAAAALVFAIARLTSHLDDELRLRRRGAAAWRFAHRGDPAWWPEFEREFADYVRGRRPGLVTAAVRRSRAGRKTRDFPGRDRHASGRD
jgi:hypothetical protein